MIDGHLDRLLQFALQNRQLLGSTLGNTVPPPRESLDVVFYIGLRLLEFPQNMFSFSLQVLGIYIMQMKEIIVRLPPQRKDLSDIINKITHPFGKQFTVLR